MSIHEIYRENAKKGFDAAYDVVERNCTQCTAARCRNMQCPNMRAMMDISERGELTKEQKDKYFKMMGG